MEQTIIELDISSYYYKSVDKGGRFYSRNTFMDAIKKATNGDRKLLVTKSLPRNDSVDMADIITIALEDVVGEILEINEEKAMVNLNSALNESFKNFIIKYKDGLKLTPRIILREYIPGTLEILDMDIICFDLIPKKRIGQ